MNELSTSFFTKDDFSGKLTYLATGDTTESIQKILGRMTLEEIINVVEQSETLVAGVTVLSVSMDTPIKYSVSKELTEGKRKSRFFSRFLKK